jgi:photosystem II stability/assembly factor-like uncharacterized protein
MTICISHGGKTIYTSNSPSTEMLVATVDGVVFLKREDASAPWALFRRGLEGHHVVALMIEPTSRTIFASMHDSGVAASEDGGETWEFRNQGLASSNVYCLNYSVSDSKVRLYAGTEPAHLFVSDDWGRNWRELSSLRMVPSVPKWTFPAPPHNAHVKNVAVDPNNPDVLYACVEQGGAFKSTDGGGSWEELHGFNDDCHRMIIMPSDSEKLFLPTGYGFYRSKDGGESWEELTQRVARIGYPDPLVFNPRNEQLMFLAGAEADPFHWMQTKSANPRIARTRDGGETWEILGNGMPQHLNANFEAMILEAWDSSCAIYAANTDGEIYCSEDEGDNWSKIIVGLPAISKTIHYTILRADLSFDKKQRAEA